MATEASSSDLGMDWTRTGPPRQTGPVVDTENRHGRPELRVVMVQPVLGGAWQRLGGAEVPEEEPDQERDVPEELHVGRGQRPQGPERRGPERAR